MIDHSSLDIIQANSWFLLQWQFKNHII